MEKDNEKKVDLVGSFRDWLHEGHVFNGLTKLCQIILILSFAGVVVTTMITYVHINVVNILISNSVLPENFTTLDIMMYIGVPILFVNGVMFLVSWLVVKWLWGAMSRFFEKLRKKHTKELKDKYNKQDNKEKKTKQKGKE